MNQILYYVLTKQGNLQGPYIHASTATRIASRSWCSGRVVTYEAKPITVSKPYATPSTLTTTIQEQLKAQFPEAFQ